MKLRIGGEIEVEIIEDVLPRLVFSTIIGGIKIEDIRMLVLPIDHKVPASIQPVDAAGNPAAVDGVPVWTSSAPTIVTVIAAVDGMSAEIVPAGLLGTAQVNVQADADLGSGVTAITGILDVQSVAGTAVGLQIQTGAPIPIAGESKK